MCSCSYVHHRVWSCDERLQMIMSINLELRMHTYAKYVLHYTSRWSMRWWRGYKPDYHIDIHFVHLIFAKCYIDVCMCRRELSVIGFLLFLVFTTEVLYKVVLYTFVPYPPQTTDQHSPWWVSKATSLSTSPPSPTPSKRAAASTQSAPCTSQWSTLCPLRQ